MKNLPNQPINKLPCITGEEDNVLAESIVPTDTVVVYRSIQKILNKFIFRTESYFEKVLYCTVLYGT